jgi:hypothetical protein
MEMSLHTKADIVDLFDSSGDHHRDDHQIHDCRFARSPVLHSGNSELRSPDMGKQKLTPQIIGAVGAFLGEVYIHGQLSVKREMSNAKSPLFSHFSAAVNGIVSIRAFGAQEKLRREARKRADKYTRAATAFYNLNRWVTVRIDMLGGLFAALLAAFLVYGPRMDASTAGFALNQAIAFSYTILVSSAGRVLCTGAELTT